MLRLYAGFTSLFCNYLLCFGSELMYNSQMYLRTGSGIRCVLRCVFRVGDRKARIV